MIDNDYKSLITYPDFNLDLLKSNINDCKMWSKRNLNLQNIEESFRSVALKPNVDVRDLSVSDEAKFLSTNIVAKYRNSIITKSDLSEGEKTSGRVLAFYPVRSMGDAIVGSECDYFIDEDDIPAWDLWLQFLSGGYKEGSEYDACLLCFVPRELVGQVDKAIQLYCYGCFRWAVEVEEHVNNSLS